LSPGGLSQALDRLATKVKPQYDAIATIGVGEGIALLLEAA